MGIQGSSAAKKSKPRKIVIAIAAVVIIVSVAAGIAVFFEAPQQTFFKGAYGVYQSVYTYSNMTFQVTSHLEVVDMNSTIATFVQNVTTISNGTSTNSSTLGYYDLQARHFIINMLFNGTHGEDLQYNNATRHCLVYEYVAIQNYQVGTFSVYYDNETGWILKQVNSMPTYHADLELVETNVPGLS